MIVIVDYFESLDWFALNSKNQPSQALNLFASPRQILFLIRGECCYFVIKNIGKLSVSIVHVSRLVDGRRQVLDFDLKPSLDLVENLLVFLGGDKGDCQSFGTIPACSADTVQVLVRLDGHIIVDDNVDFLDINVGISK